MTQFFLRRKSPCQSGNSSFKRDSLPTPTPSFPIDVTDTEVQLRIVPCLYFIQMDQFGQGMTSKLSPIP